MRSADFRGVVEPALYRRVGVPEYNKFIAPVPGFRRQPSSVSGPALAGGGATTKALARLVRALERKEVAPGYHYHATNEERAQDIARAGELRPHEPSFGTEQDMWPDRGTEPRSYFGGPENVWQFAPEHGRPVVLRAPSHAAKFQRESTGDHFLRDPLSAAYLEALTEAEGWRPLVELLGQHERPEVPIQLRLPGLQEGGSIQATPRGAFARMYGDLGTQLQAFTERQRDTNPLTATLLELLYGNAGQALEDWSYGQSPFGMPGAAKGVAPHLYGMRTDPRVIDVAGLLSLPPAVRGVAAPLGRAVTPALERAARAVPGMPAAAFGEGLPGVQAIKSRGGQWLGSEPYTSNLGVYLDDLATDARLPEATRRELRALSEAEQLRAAEQKLGRTLTPEEAEKTPINMQEGLRNPVETWINKQLKRYVMTDLGTPTDPLLQSAARGELHLTPEQLREGVQNLHVVDVRARHPELREMTVLDMSRDLSPEKQYELISEAMIDKMPRISAQQRAQQFGQFEEGAGGEEAARGLAPHYQWLERLKPDDVVHDISESLVIGDSLGFAHMVDYLRQLPARELSKLKNMSVPDVARKVSQWNAGLAKRSMEQAIESGAMLEHKAYPTGYRWVELKDKDALRAEGQAMGHCVGGYCDAVEQGGTRILSLRDPQGKPHVTVEVRPGQHKVSDMLAEMTGEEHQTFNQIMESYGYRQNTAGQFVQTTGNQRGSGAEPDLVRKALEDVVGPRMGESPQTIFQIKGKQNAKPKDEYLPYVQDFVKSQPWGRVGDLDNTGLLEFKGPGGTMYPRGLYNSGASGAAQAQGVGVPTELLALGIHPSELKMKPGYYTPQEMEKAMWEAARWEPYAGVTDTPGTSGSSGMTLANTGEIISRERHKALMELRKARGYQEGGRVKANPSLLADLSSMFSEVERKYELPRGLMHNLAETESQGDVRAVSKAGARGLFQLMPITQTHLKVKDPFDPHEATWAAGRYLKEMYDKFGDWHKALAAWNWGPGNLLKHGMEKMPDETRGLLSKTIDRLINQPKVEPPKRIPTDRELAEAAGAGEFGEEASGLGGEEVNFDELALELLAELDAEIEPPTEQPDELTATA